MKNNAFKTCTNCGHIWQTMEDFLSDQTLQLAGYQAHFDDLLGGLILFTHAQEDCYTTLAIEVRQFTSLTRRPILNVRTHQPDGCKEICMREGTFDPCPIKCECSWVREILQTIKDWSQKAA
jgi:hypothetical protein